MEKLSDDIINKYLLGDCSEEEITAISARIQESDDDARRLFKAEEIFYLGKYKQYTSEERLAKAERKFCQRLQDEGKKKSRVLHLHRMMKYAAVLVLAFVSGGVGMYYVNNLSERDLLVASATDGVKQIVLSDGTKVWLNKASTLKYPEKFTGSTRQVHLDGEAFFEVAKNRKKPFLVKNEVLNVRVLGTVFNFKSRKNAAFSHTTLVEGQVEVMANRTHGKVVLVPGQRAELNRSSGLLTVRQVDANLDGAWHTDQISFQQATILEIAHSLEQIYNVKVIVSPDVQLERTYSGVVKKKENIESVFKTLQNSIPFNYKSKGSYIFITPLYK